MDSICITTKHYEPLDGCKDCSDYEYGICGMSDAYKQGWNDALEDFVINLIGDMDAYESNGHNLDVKAWARNYVQVMTHEVG